MLLDRFEVEFANHNSMLIFFSMKEYYGGQGSGIHVEIREDFTLNKQKSLVKVLL